MIYRILRRLLLPLFLRRVTQVEGAEHIPPSDGFCIAANHIDYLDGFVVSAVIGRERPRMVTFISETGNYWWARGSTIPLDRSHKAASLDRAQAALERGINVCIFPEGQRNPTKTLLPGKTGLARLAARSGRPLLPMGLFGPSGKNFLGSVMTFIFRRQPIRVRFGPPLMFQPTNNEITKPVLVSMTNTIMEALGRVCEKSPTIH